MLIQKTKQVNSGVDESEVNVFTFTLNEEDVRNAIVNKIKNTLVDNGEPLINVSTLDSLSTSMFAFNSTNNTVQQFNEVTIVMDHVPDEIFEDLL